MGRVIDLEARRPSLAGKRRDAKAAEMRDAFRNARASTEESTEGAKKKATRKLLDIYRSRKPSKR